MKKKMQKEKKIALLCGGIMALALTVWGMTTVSQVYAEDTETEYRPLVQNLASKFGLDMEDVQQVIIDTRNDQRENRLNEHLDTLVEDKIITSTQKALIVGKLVESREKLHSIRSNEKMSVEEKKEATKTVFEESKSWAEANDIPLNALRPMKRDRQRSFRPNGEEGWMKHKNVGMGMGIGEKTEE